MKSIIFAIGMLSLLTACNTVDYGAVSYDFCVKYPNHAACHQTNTWAINHG